jgi:Tol biopolymer transport system component
VAFVGIVEGNRQIYLRRLEQTSSVPVKGTEGATGVFFSPNSRSIGAVLTSGLLETVSLDDGLVVSLLRDADINSGGAWGSDDRITFGRNRVLWQVPASGGSATQVTTLEAEKKELAHAFPVVLPGGKGILFAVLTGSSRGAVHIEAVSPADEQRHVVIEPGVPLHATGQHLIFVRDPTLLAVPFDADRLEVSGAPVRVLDGVRVSSLGSAMVGISSTGSVAYMSGAAASQLVWVSRQGVEQRLTDSARSYAFPNLSHDGRRVVVSLDGGDVWIADTERPALTRITTEATTGNSYPVWTPDGKRVIFRTSLGLYSADAEGSSRSQAIPGTSAADFPNAVSPDGEWLAFLRVGGDRSGDIYAVSLRGDAKPRPLVNTQAYEGGAQFSPDGRWVAFASDESGYFQVFVRPFNGPDRKWLVSQAGKYPRWNRNGKELFYRDGHKMMVVDVSIAADAPVFSSPRMLFEQRYEFGAGQTTANYDVTADGQRFVMVKDQSGSSQLSIVLNWFVELARLAPPGR